MSLPSIKQSNLEDLYEFAFEHGFDECKKRIFEKLNEFINANVFDSIKYDDIKYFINRQMKENQTNGGN